MDYRKIIVDIEILRFFGQKVPTLFCVDKNFEINVTKTKYLLEKVSSCSSRCKPMFIMSDAPTPPIGGKWELSNLLDDRH